jgi:hypothetical protein
VTHPNDKLNDPDGWEDNTKARQNTHSQFAVETVFCMLILIKPIYWPRSVSRTWISDTNEGVSPSTFTRAFFPLEPGALAFRQHIGTDLFHETSSFPMPAPPIGRMLCPAFLCPKRKEMLGKLPVRFAHKSRYRDPNPPAGLDKLLQVI